MKETHSSSEPYNLRIEKTPRTLRELALERMRSAILEFRFRPGERLVERTLCDQLGVSRSVVREVIRHLESEGLVENIPNQGPIIANLDPVAAAEIYEIRGLLEAAAARACAENASEDALALLGEALAGIESAHAAKDTRAVLSATTRFYETMFSSGGKLVAWDVVRRLNGRISHLRAMTIASEGRAQTGPQQMRRIFDAIGARDPEAAEDACRAHVARAAEIAKDLLENRD